ncbi:MAG: hypothetical protein AAF629_30510 [Chloroflexota bacterium]
MKQQNKESGKGDEPMVIKSLSIQNSLWLAARRKAGGELMSVSEAIRLLLKAWLADDIDLSQYKNENTK